MPSGTLWVMIRRRAWQIRSLNPHPRSGYPKGTYRSLCVSPIFILHPKFLAHRVSCADLCFMFYAVCSSMHSLVCIGGINLDRKAHCLQAVVPATSNPVRFSDHCGGVARNVSENLGRLACQPIMLGCVGDDREGAWVLEQTQAHGVNIDHVTTIPHARTGTYTAVLDPSGEMVLGLADMSINEQFTAERLAHMWHIIPAHALIFLDANLPADSLAYVIERCHAEHLRLVIDPISPIKTQRLPHDLTGVSAMLPNRHEAAVLADLAPVTLETCAIAAQRIHARGVQTVVITLGAEGLFVSGDGIQRHLPALNQPVVDVTGAGDALTAGFLYGMATRQSLERCCELGMNAAALTVRTDQSVAPDLSLSRLEAMG